jgi:biopolymer transport protein TolR
MAATTAMQRRAHRKHRGGAALDMNLVSLIDVFTILIFFLLSSSGGVETLASPKAVKLPISNVEQPARETVVVVVTNEDISVEGRRVALVKDVMAPTGVANAVAGAAAGAASGAASSDAISALKNELDLLSQRKAVRADVANKIASDGHAVTILADRAVPYQLLRKVMFSCAQAGFSDVSFALRRKDG